MAGGVTRNAEVTLTAGNTFQSPVLEQIAQQRSPAIVGGTGSFNVREDAATGAVVTTIVASDADGDPLSYAINLRQRRGPICHQQCGCP
jgi:hypothetical protein